MKRSEQKAKLKKLYRQIEELKNVKIEEDGVWKPKLYEEYWFIDDFGKVYKDTWDCSYADNIRFNIGNVFRKEEEAKHEVERRKVLIELKQFSREFKYGFSNFCLHSYGEYNEFVYQNFPYQKSLGALYFESKEILKQAIEKVGEERIKKYLFGVE